MIKEYQTSSTGFERDPFKICTVVLWPLRLTDLVIARLPLAPALYYLGHKHADTWLTHGKCTLSVRLRAATVPLWCHSYHSTDGYELNDRYDA
jgi:hypothetical protein